MLTVVLAVVAIISTGTYRSFVKGLSLEADRWMMEQRSIAYQLSRYISRRLYNACGFVRDATIGVALMSYFLDLGLMPIIVIAAFAAGLGLYACSTVWEVKIDPYQ